MQSTTIQAVLVEPIQPGGGNGNLSVSAIVAKYRLGWHGIGSQVILDNNDMEDSLVNPSRIIGIESIESELFC
ncbi:MAG: hypothetical protein ABIQ93_07745, partial [Saprospiraceae bacterium]